MKQKNPSAFTLVELLVVMTIVVVLLALLFPAIQRGRESANRSKCASNLKQLAAAGLMYVADHDGRAFQNWNGLNPDPQVYGPDGRYVSGEGGIMGYIYPNADPNNWPPNGTYEGTVASCPSRQRRVTKELPIYGGAKKKFYLGEENIANGGNGLYEGMGYARNNSISNPGFNGRIVNFRNLSKYMMFLDGSQWNDGGNLAPEMMAFSPRHSGFGNWAFWDGHVEYVRSMYGSPEVMALYWPQQ